ncbi:MAG: ATP-binding protein, partial [Geodermatophilaceae bacterium]
MPRPPALLRRSFGTRLALTLALTGIGGALLAALLVNLAFQSRFDSFVSQQQQEREDQLLAVVTASYVDADGWDAQALSTLAPAAIMTGAKVTVYDDAGQRIWSTADSAMGAAMGQRHQEMMGLEPLGDVRQLPVVVDGRQVGTMTVAVPQDGLPSGEQEFLASVNQLLLGAVALAGLVAVVAGTLLARRATKPISQLTVAARGLAAGDRSFRAEFARDDEVGQLATAVNSMADAVEREDQVRRSFAADVAHELRTPLAILRSQIEAVQDGLAEPTPAVLASLHEETVRLGRLVGDLETMTSADAAAFQLDLRPVPLADVVATTAAAMLDRFTSAGLTLQTDLAPVTVTGDADRLTQILTNLFTNALKFVPSGGRVTVALDRAQGMARLQVSDDGSGIDPEDRAHIFDRFFRGRGPRIGGSGVGMAVVAELVRAHGGRV